ncbi:MAG: PilZ domain-containing protein [Phycisphaerales bacterium]
MTTMTDPNINRRAFERFVLNPGYTAAAVRRHPDDSGFDLEGHVYDLSEGGICFELDEPLEPGSTVSMRITLPTNCGEVGLDPAIELTGNIVWCDLEEPGASRMALAITHFDRPGDKGRMMRAFSAKRYLRAA